jgi:predicted alpha/beta-fold hydrolase
MVVSTRPALAGAGFRYPDPFRRWIVPGADGVPIAATVAVRPRAPAIVVVPGAMTTRGSAYVRRVAVRLWRAGFTVAAIDLRGFGGTGMLSAAPSSLGFKEGEDVVAVDEWLHGLGAPSVGALGFSLGGAAVLCGARAASLLGRGLEGGVLALAPPTDALAALVRVSRRPAPWDPLFPTWLTLRAATGARSPLAVATVAIPSYYGLDVEAAARRSSAVSFADALDVPVLVLHAEDDVVVPVAHARALAEAAAANPMVQVMTTSWGGHAAFDALDPVWMQSVEIAWFGSLRRD